MYLSRCGASHSVEVNVHSEHFRAVQGSSPFASQQLAELLWGTCPGMLAVEHAGGFWHLSS